MSYWKRWKQLIVHVWKDRNLMVTDVGLPDTLPENLFENSDEITKYSLSCIRTRRFSSCLLEIWTSN